MLVAEIQSQSADIGQSDFPDLAENRIAYDGPRFRIFNFKNDSIQLDIKRVCYFEPILQNAILICHAMSWH